MRRIVVLEDSQKNPFGGGQKISSLIITILFKASYSIVLADCGQNSPFHKSVKPYLADYIKLSCLGKIEGGKKSTLNLGMLEILFLPFKLYQSYRILAQYFNEKMFNQYNSIVYVTTKKQLLLAWLLYFFRRIPYIFHAHLVENPQSLYFYTYKKILKTAYKVIYVSKTVSYSHQCSQGVLIYNPTINRSSVIREISQPPYIFATFSSLIPLKGIEYFINAYKFLQEKEKYEFRIYGEGPEKERLMQVNQEDNIRFLGFCSEPQNAMKELTGLIVPSIIEESSSMVALEAFSQAIPVIATNIGGQAEIVINGVCGLHIPPYDSQALADAIQTLCKPEIYTKLSYGAYKRAEEFDITIFQDKILALFKESDDYSPN